MGDKVNNIRNVDAYCNTRLQLGLGVGEYAAGTNHDLHLSSHHERKEDKPLVCLDLSLSVCPKREVWNLSAHDLGDDDDAEVSNTNLKTKVDDAHDGCKEQYGCTGREKSVCYPNNKNLGRKKLRLSKQQSTLLEDSFKRQTTINPSQKQALAEELNLKPRQVEVWFQNRRARTKLKQTEVDREFLTKRCQNLRDENARLKEEVQELRSIPHKISYESSSTLCTQIPKDSKLPLICRSCKKLINGM